MIILKINKNILIAILLLSVFAVGTMTCVDTVDAAKWKKYNSGSFNDEYPAYGYQKYGTYQSYVKGNNELYVNTYSYKENNARKLDKKITFTKKNGKMKIAIIDYSWKERKSSEFKTFKSVKSVYKYYIKDFTKNTAISPSKAAFDKHTLYIDGQTVKTYAIKIDSSCIQIFFYVDGKEFSSQTIDKYKKTVTMKQYDYKRNIFAQDVFKTTKSVNTIYREVINDYLTYNY